MASEELRVTSGVSQLDHLLDGLCIGDNVVWYDVRIKKPPSEISPGGFG